jgi:hypothetical protein
MRLCLAIAAVVLVAEPVQAAKLTGLQVDPPVIALTHSEDSHRILVTGLYDDGTTRDLTRAVQYLPLNTAVISVSERGTITPKATGETAVEVKVEALSKSIPVKVTSIAPRPVSYANDVIPVLSKSGCNSGACHGAASGKKGFKLTLRGYDPAADYMVLARGTDAHRLNRLEPAKSLMLQKATGAVLHEGGKLFDLNSRYGKILERWIAEGTPNDLKSAPALVDLEVFPKFRALPATNLDQQLLVLAKFSDGSVRDVTADSRYSSSNELAFTIDEAGYVKVNTKGEAAITARYGPKIAISTIVAMDHDPKFAWPNPPEANYVDKLVFEKLKRMQIAPSELCSDAEFLRRVYYDVIGLPPTPEEVKKFLADTRSDKRAKIVDELLERPEHAEYWALKWTDLFKLRFEQLGDKGTWGLYRQVRDSIAGNQRFDKFVQEILTAEGSTTESPAANYYRVFNTPDEASEATVQIFFGVRLLCAKCHDHPFEKWVQKDYYGMSAFFTQLTNKPGGRRGDTVVFRNENPPRSRHPNTGEALLPKFLDAASVDLKGEQDARVDLARWMTAKENPFFAKATVNRLWSHLFGKGIIDPVDDIRTGNPPANGPLLEALTKDFTDHDFDVRHILKVMLNSRVYQLSARTNSTNADDTSNFSHRLPRRLSAEQLLDTLSQATGIKQGFRSRYGEATIALPANGVRAGQLPDKQLTAETLDLFGRPRGESSCACERHEEASMTQALHLINGKSVVERIQNPGNAIAKIVQRPKIADEQIIEELYLLALCRTPNAKEVEVMKKHFTAAGNDKLKAAQDALWVLFNTREFLFNH